ncbi:MAG: ferrous iron transport protein B [Oscillospiraceae bacterium]|nr:ferrous iron transport protein B [Oscillospiraceae bacterium]
MENQQTNYTKHTIALVGNPNIGKTTIFNKLTGDDQAIGNWPGVTVEKKQGKIKYSEYDIELTDLPGIYSLTAYSADELVARKFILDEKPHVLLNVVDGTNLERNLYLSVQLLEIGVPTVLAINMADELKRKGITLNTQKLAQKLNIPVIDICAIKNQSLDELVKICEDTAHHTNYEPNFIKYNEPTEVAIAEIFELFKLKNNSLSRFFSIKLLEKDETIFNLLTQNIAPDEQLTLKQSLQEITKRYEQKYHFGSCESLIADARYEFITSLLEGVVFKKDKKSKHSISDKIDKVVLNKYTAYPIFLLVLLAIFAISFDYGGQKLTDKVSDFINTTVYNYVAIFLTNCSAPVVLKRLVLEAVLGGVGSVLTFLPQLSLLFMFLSLLEDSGYMARIVMITDKLLKKLGITGKAFIPIIMGLGCTTSAIMSTRIIENEHERKRTILLLPFISCSAKLPVYGLIANIFFSRHLGLVIFSMYLIGVLLGVLVALIFKKFFAKTEDSIFLIELQPYKIPSVKVVLANTLKECWEFVKKAGTVLFLVSVLIWVLSNFNWQFKMVDPGTESILKSFGVKLAPLFKPLGFGYWQIVLALISGLVAKEAIVSSLSVIYGEIAVLSASLTNVISPLGAYSLMLFILLYTPCVSAFMAAKNEFKSFKPAVFSMVWQISIAYITSLAFFQISSFILK